MTKKRVDIVVTEKGANKAARGLKRVDGAMGAMAKSAALYVGGAAALIGMIKKSVDAFGVQEQAEKRLETALGGVNKSLLAQASALQQVSTFGDEAILGVQASIAAFTDDEEAIKKATKATLDMAAATGMDLKAAGDLVAKSLGSSTNALSRYGIEVTGAVGSSERLDTLTANIADKFEGQAAAAADTMAGSMAQAKNAMGDAAEVVGGALAPAITVLAKGIKGATELLFGLNTEIDKLERKSRESTQWTWERAKANKRLTEQWKELEKQAKILAPIDEEMRDLQIDTNIHLAENIELIETQASVVNDLSYNFDAAYDAAGRFSDAMVQSIIYGQDLGDAFKSAAKAIAVDMISAYIKNKLISSTTLAATVAESIAAAKVIAAAWATPASLAATATAGASAISGQAALASSIAASKAIAAFAKGGDFVTNGPQLILVGDNPGGRERVQVTPESSPNINGPSGVTVNFYGDFIGDEEMIERKLIPGINRAVSQGRASLA